MTLSNEKKDSDNEVLNSSFRGLGGIVFMGTPEFAVPSLNKLLQAGYNIVGLGYNFGVSLKALPNQRVCPYLIEMYGYNAVIKITGLSGYDKIYYGPSAGLGLEIWNRRRFNYFNFEFILPFRPKEEGLGKGQAYSSPQGSPLTF